MENLSSEQIINKIAELQSQYNVARKESPSRISSYNYAPLQSISCIKLQEKLSEEIDILKAELQHRSAPEGQQLYFILRNIRDYDVIPTIVEKGIVKKGGFLENYFIGKGAAEHKTYVEHRHNKKLRLIEYEDAFINTEDNISGTIDITVKIDGVKFTYSSEFQITVNRGTYLYIRLSKKVIKGETDRGASNYQRCLCAYAAAYKYHELFAPDKNINVR